MHLTEGNLKHPGTFPRDTTCFPLTPGSGFWAWQVVGEAEEALIWSVTGLMGGKSRHGLGTPGGVTHTNGIITHMVGGGERMGCEPPSQRYRQQTVKVSFFLFFTRQGFFISIFFFQFICWWPLPSPAQSTARHCCSQNCFTVCVFPANCQSKGDPHRPIKSHNPGAGVCTLLHWLPVEFHSSGKKHYKLLYWAATSMDSDGQRKQYQANLRQNLWLSTNASQSWNHPMGFKTIS